MAKLNKLIVLILGLLLLPGIITGCGRNEVDRTQLKKTFIFARSNDSLGLDSANVSDSESIYVTHQIMESLLEYKPDSTEVEPALATDWESSKDGLVWTFKLREGVMFQDGTDFNAQAVKFNFDRWRMPDHPQHQGDFEYYRSMFGGFPGIIRDVKVVDDFTVRFFLTKPLAPFLSDLAMPAFAIASPQALKKYGKDFSNHPVGTGPFRFVKWDKDKEIVLKRYSNYWGEKALVGKVVFRAIPDITARLKELQQGKVHVALNINPEDVPTVEKDPNLDVLYRPSMDIGYLAMNTNKYPLNLTKVRKAINYAINKEDLVNRFYGGLAKPAKNPLPPSVWGYNDDVKDYPYNPALSKALLAEAGFPDGFRIKLWAPPNARAYLPKPMEMVRAIQQDLAKVGIKADIVTYPWGEYIQKGENGEHDLYLIGWIGDNGDPDNFLFMLLDKNSAVKGSASNVAFYKNDRVHDLLSKAQEETDQRRRAVLYRKAQLLIKDDAPWVPLVHTTVPAAVSKSVKNWLPHATGTEPFNRVEIQ